MHTLILLEDDKEHTRLARTPPPVGLCSDSHTYSGGTGKTWILRSIVPKSRRVRWLSANSK
jgi:hypothetical protein